jgi:hypothetical protein
MLTALTQLYPQTVIFYHFQTSCPSLTARNNALACPFLRETATKLIPNKTLNNNAEPN